MIEEDFDIISAYVMTCIGERHRCVLLPSLRGSLHVLHVDRVSCREFSGRSFDYNVFLTTPVLLFVSAFSCSCQPCMRTIITLVCTNLSSQAPQSCDHFVRVGGLGTEFRVCSTSNTTHGTSAMVPPMDNIHQRKASTRTSQFQALRNQNTCGT